MTQAAAPDRHYVRVAKLFKKTFQAVDSEQLMSLLSRLNTDYTEAVLLEFAQSREFVGDEQVGDFLLSATQFVILSELERRRGVRVNA